MTFRMWCAKFMLCMVAFIPSGITLDEFIGRAPNELVECWQRGEDPIDVARELIKILETWRANADN
jgi:hypothetical protein